MKTRFTLNDINDVIETFEDFLERYNVRIPDSDYEMTESGCDPKTNIARIYGTVYGDLMFDLLELFEKKAKAGKVAEVVNCWDDEVEAWEEWKEEDDD